MTDWPGWEQQVEAVFGAASGQDTALWDAWQVKEGDGGRYNPLNTTTPVQTPYGAGVRDPGSWNTAGVLDYPNPEAGAWATHAAVAQNAPGLYRGLSVQNPLDMTDTELTAGFNWLGGGPGNPRNQEYALSVVDAARQTSGQGGPGGKDVGACVSACIKQGGDAKNCCEQCGGSWQGGLCNVAGGGPSSGGISGGSVLCSGPCCDVPLVGELCSFSPACIACKAALGGGGGGGSSGGQSGGSKGLIACMSGASGVSVGPVSVPGTQTLNQAACFLSLDGLEVLAGFVLVIVGAARLAGVRLPSVVPMPV